MRAITTLAIPALLTVLSLCSSAPVRADYDDEVCRRKLNDAGAPTNGAGVWTTIRPQIINGGYDYNAVRTCRKRGHYGLPPDIWEYNMATYYVTDPFVGRWRGKGGASWGMPVEDGKRNYDGIGRHQQFRGKEGEWKYISWHPTFGARAVEGTIYREWSNQGSEDGWLGYPTGEEYVTSDCPYGVAGSWRQQFQHGYICAFFHPRTGNWSTWSMGY